MALDPSIRRQGSGYAAEGSDFYTWDEEPETLVGWAVALHEAARPGAPTPEPAPTAGGQKRSV